MATAVITNKNPVITKVIEDASVHNTYVTGPVRLALINETLPFRIRFTSIQIPGYNQNNIPGIGLQVIGFSNWIL